MGNEALCCNTREQDKQFSTIPKFEGTKSIRDSSQSSESLSTFSVINMTDTIYLECERPRYDSEHDN